MFGPSTNFVCVNEPALPNHLNFEFALLSGRSKGGQHFRAGAMEAQWSVMEALRRSDSENDPQLGPQLMEREVDRLESEVARLKEKLFKAEDKIAEMERETEHRYVKMKGDVVENSMQLLHGFQRSHIDAQDMSTRRIAFLETELDQANKELARFSDVRRELLKKQAECKELSEALEELELQHRAQKEAKTGVVRAQSADTVVALLSQELLVQVSVGGVCLHSYVPIGTYECKQGSHPHTHTHTHTHTVFHTHIHTHMHTHTPLRNGL